MTDHFFRAADNQYQLDLSANLVLKMHDIAKKTCGLETGGLIIGFYDEAANQAIPTFITKPPADSRSTNAHFERGVVGVNDRLRGLWGAAQRQYYLGEWHFHPSRPPIASQQDIRQMQAISKSAKYRCPAPLLVILGGKPASKWHVSAYIFPRNETFIELIKD